MSSKVSPVRSSVLAMYFALWPRSSGSPLEYVRPFPLRTHKCRPENWLCRLRIHLPLTTATWPVLTLKIALWYLLGSLCVIMVYAMGVGWIFCLLSFSPCCIDYSLFHNSWSLIFFKISRFILGVEQPYFACSSESTCPNWALNLGFCSSAVKKVFKKSLSKICIFCELDF